MREPSSANSGIPDLAIWDSIRNCATASLARLSSEIEGEIASDETIAGLRKTGSLRLAMHARAQEWMRRAYRCCLKCWEECQEQETPEFVLAVSIYALSPFYWKEMLKLLRLAAGVSRETLNCLEAGRSSLRADHTALSDAAEVWKEMLGTWQTALPVFESLQGGLSPVEASSSSSSVRPLPKAPSPPTQLSGTGGWSPPKPKPAEVPTEFPPSFPPSLVLRTKIIVAECVRDCPDRSDLERLCREIVSKCTDLLCTAVRQGTLKAHSAPDQINELLQFVRVANCESDNDRYRVEKIVINSAEWLAMLTRLAECENEEQPDPGKVARKSDDADHPRRRIEAFIQKLADNGYQITKKDIWQVAGYTEPTEFERFQRGDERTTKACERNFMRVLNMSPESFVAVLKKVASR